MGIKEIIEKEESETTEFKKSTAQLEKALKTICGFLNHIGGVVYFGIDDGEVVGQEVSDQTLKSISQKIRQKIKPEVTPEVKVLEIMGKRVIEVTVKEGGNKPYYLAGIAYKRIGTENPIISPEELERTILERRTKYWDSEICEEASLDDIDEDKVRWYLERREGIRKVKKPEKMDIKTLLLNVGAAKRTNGEIKPTNAGILFFCENPQRFVLQSRLRLARFDGKTLTRDFLDRLDCSGALWEMIDASEDFIRKNIRLFGFRTEYSFQRIDKLEYPIKAIREGIINALIHRNYFAPADTRVAIFDDRIEIISPGTFPEGVTPKNPKHVPVNPALCQLMYDVGFIEKYGSGIYMINELCDEWGIPGPEYELSEVETKVIFRSSGKAIVISEIEKLGVELNDRQKEGIKVIFEKGKITNADYAKMFEISRNTATNDLSDLIEKGLIKRVGRGRGSYYAPKI